MRRGLHLLVGVGGVELHPESGGTAGPGESTGPLPSCSSRRRPPGKVGSSGAGATRREGERVAEAEGGE